MLPFESLWKFLNLCKILKNDQTYFCGVNIATFLKYLWPFFNIMHERYTFHKFEFIRNLKIYPRLQNKNCKE